MKSVKYSVVPLDDENSEAYQDYMSTENRYDEREHDLFRFVCRRSNVNRLNQLIAEANIPKDEKDEVLRNLFVLHVFDMPNGQRILYFLQKNCIIKFGCTIAIVWIFALKLLPS